LKDPVRFLRRHAEISEGSLSVTLRPSRLFPQLGVICLPHAVAADPVCFYDRDSAAGSDDVLVSRFF
jgi:hypothetical protein